ncbi:ABC transporter permease subunit [Corynebacterium sp. 3HC-13]|nr:ABC transporter permease subunit [Corynebacterium poyangense]
MNMVREFRKLKRLKIPYILLGMSLLMGLMIGANFSGSSGKGQYAMLLQSVNFVLALLVPITAAVVSNLSIDMEHRGHGWIFNVTSGVSTVRLLWSKFLVDSIVICCFVIFNYLSALFLGRLLGVTSSFNLIFWLSNIVCICLVSTTFIGFHILCASRWENQLISMAIGVLGGLLGIYGFLLPDVLARFIPWGYFAVSSHVIFTEQGNTFDAVYLYPPYLWIFGYFVASIALFYWGSYLTSQEKAK